MMMDWGRQLDYLIVVSPQETGDIQLSCDAKFFQWIVCDYSNHPSRETSLIDVRKTINVFKNELKYPWRNGPVQNMDTQKKMMKKIIFLEEMELLKRLEIQIWRLLGEIPIKKIFLNHVLRAESQYRMQKIRSKTSKFFFDNVNCSESPSLLNLQKMMVES